MEFLLAIIVLQMAYIIYNDIQVRAERERFILKIMSKDVSEYKDAISGPESISTPEEDDPYIDVADAGIERVLKSKEV